MVSKRWSLKGTLNVFKSHSTCSSLPPPTVEGWHQLSSHQAYFISLSYFPLHCPSVFQIPKPFLHRFIFAQSLLWIPMSFSSLFSFLDILTDLLAHTYASHYQPLQCLLTSNTWHICHLVASSLTTKFVILYCHATVHCISDEIIRCLNSASRQLPASF